MYQYLAYTALTLTLGGCAGYLASKEKSGNDADGDGTSDNVDCDPLHENESPTDTITVYLDEDEDAYGLENTSYTTCTEYFTDDTIDGMLNGIHVSKLFGDCDDANASINPAAYEICDEVDNNCNGLTDDEDSESLLAAIAAGIETFLETFFVDEDGDTYGSTEIVDACAEGEGLSTNSDDFDDTRSDSYPGASEIWYDGIDQNGDGLSDYNQDGDGYDSSDYAGDDCDDTDSSINPSVSEVNGNGVDDDCDSSTTYYLSGTGSISDGVMLRGVSGSDFAGIDNAIVPDVSGDGYDDVVVGAPGDDNANGTGSGAVYVVPASVSSSSADLDAAGVIPIIGAGINHQIGRAVAGGGDLTGDGNADLLISSYNPDLSGAYAGVSYVVEGPLSSSVDLASTYFARLIGEGATDYSGDGALAVVGDTNGDGNQDVAIGAYGSQGNYGGAYLLHGPLSSGDTSLSTADGTWSGEEESSGAGTAIAGPGDMDGDGNDDLVVGSPAYSSYQGAAYLLLCPCDGDGDLADADSRLLGENDEDAAGKSLSGAGDIDGDGYQDLVVGAYGVNGYTGRAYVVGGSSVSAGDVSLATAMASVDGESAADFLGFTVSGGGDVDGDGFDDILLGAEGHDDPATDAGASYLVYGYTPFTGSLSWDAKWTGTSASDTSGHRVWLGGDVNADGYADSLIGTYLYDTTQTDAGASVLFMGGDL